MSDADHTSIADAAPGLSDEPILSEAEVPAEVIATNPAEQVLASDPDFDGDALEEPGGLRDVDSPLPDNWQGPRVGGDELENAVREAEHFPSTDQANEEELPREGGAPASVRARPTATARMLEPVQSMVVWQHVLGDPARIPSNLVNGRAAEIKAMGQHRACRGRWTDGHIEIVTGLLEYLAVRSIAEAGGVPFKLLVDVEPMDDKQAFQIAHADAAEGAPLSPLDRARFAQSAIKEAFRTQRAMAAKLGINESNLTRLLLVAKCADIVASVVTDPWSISRAKAERFMHLHEDPLIRKELLAFIGEAKPQTASKFFAAVFAAFDPPPATRPGEVLVVSDKGEPLGRVGRKASGEVVMLDQAAGAVELPTLIRFIEAALGQLRNAMA